MFTGIIRTTGKLKRIQRKGTNRTLEISLPKLSDSIIIGDSIAVNGVCLTVTRIKNNNLWFDISEDTWDKTTFKFYRPNQLVNIEESLKTGDKIGGHFITGHIDGIGRLKKKIKKGNELRLEVVSEKGIISKLIPNGSISIDGVSLTVKEIGPDWFNLVIIPQTLKETTIKQLKQGDYLNLETDILRKYIAMHKDFSHSNFNTGGA